MCFDDHLARVSSPINKDSIFFFIFFYLVPRQQIVLRLLDDRADEIQAVGNPPRLRDLLSAPLAGPPVERPPLIDHVVHGPHRLLDRRRRVRPVAVDDVDVVHVQPLEGGFGPLDNVLAGETLVVGPWAAPEDLGGDDEVGALPAELADGLAHDLLGPSVGVHLGVVEEVDAAVAAALEEGLGLFDVQLVAEAHPGQDPYESWDTFSPDRPRLLYFILESIALDRSQLFRLSTEKVPALEFKRRRKEMVT